MNDLFVFVISLLSKSLSDPWVVFGFVAQSVFFLRFIVQWIASEREKKTVIPKLFWYLSIIGSALILIYSIYRLDIVFMVASVLNIGIYLRNIWLGRSSDTSA